MVVSLDPAARGRRKRALHCSLLVASGAALGSLSLHGTAAFVGSTCSTNRQHSQDLPRIAASPSIRLCKLQRSAVPMRLVDGGSLLTATNSNVSVLLADDLRASTAKPIDSDVELSWDDFQAVIPEDQDIPKLADLLVRSFEKLWHSAMLPASYGVLSKIWNSAYLWLQRQIAEISLRDSMSKNLRRPSVRFPLGFQVEGYSLGIMLVRKDRLDDPVAFFEIFLMPTDGRAPDDPFVQLVPLVQTGRPPATWQPYLSNLCVASTCRRRGLGRAAMELAEHIVKELWRKDSLYLHADNDDAVKKFYEACGYKVGVRVGQEDAADEKVVYMRKSLRPISASAGQSAAEADVAAEATTVETPIGV